MQILKIIEKLLDLEVDPIFLDQMLIVIEIYESYFQGQLLEVFLDGYAPNQGLQASFGDFLASEQIQINRSQLLIHHQHLLLQHLTPPIIHQITAIQLNF